MRLLLVEDDPMIGEALREGLVQAGYAVDWVRDGVQGELAAANDVYDAALLDLGLPRKDGLGVLRAIRARGDLPVLILTARDGVDDRIGGLDAGADDYIVKPFALGELLARLRAVVRRKSGRSQSDVRIGALRLDPAARIVEFRGAPVDLSAREFAVLEALAKEPGKVVSKEQLEEAVYGWGDEVSSNTVEVYLHRLRRKLAPELIRNIRGVGYRLDEIA
jgi:two-component system, OmpR family, response regulator QseB